MKIALTRSYFAEVTSEDYSRITQFNWAALVGTQIRAVRRYLGRSIYMQHQVLDIMPWELNGLEIDHIDRNPLNNRRDNLRIVTHTENMRNTLRHIQRKGYCYNKRANLWSVYYDAPDKPRIYLGYTKTEEEAINRLEVYRASR